MVTKSIITSLNLFKHLQSKEVEPFDFDRRHVTSGNSLVEATETVYDAEPQRSPRSSTDEVVKSKSRDKYRRSGPPNGIVAKAKAKAAPPWRQESPKSKKLK